MNLLQLIAKFIHPLFFDGCSYFPTGITATTTGGYTLSHISTITKKKKKKKHLPASQSGNKDPLWAVGKEHYLVDGHKWVTDECNGISHINQLDCYRRVAIKCVERGR